MAHERVSLDRISLSFDDLPNGLNLKHLYYFHAVATDGSIAQAAKRLKVSQPTISEQIKALETFLVTPLFERRKGGLRVNNEGRRVYEHTKVMFRAVRRLMYDLSPERPSEQWVLEVGVCPTISKILAVRRLLPLFKLDGVKPRVRMGEYDELLKDLLNGELDLVLTENQLPDLHRDKIGLRILTESSLVIVAAPSLSEKVNDFPKDLSRVPMMHYSQNSRYRWEVDNFLFERGVSPNVLGEVDDIELLALIACEGMAAVALPESCAAKALDDGKLCRLGRVTGSQANVFAYFTEVNTPEIVQRAVTVLLKEGAAH